MRLSTGAICIVAIELTVMQSNILHFIGIIIATYHNSR